MQRDNPQAEQEISRQRAYGERANEAGKSLADQTNPSIAVRAGEAEDRGFRRDDEDEPLNEAPVVAASDERHPNVPDYAGSDHGDKASGP